MNAGSTWQQRRDLFRFSTRRATAAARPLPDFVIIGAQRSGTTSLYRYLVAQPDIRPALRKEIHYFDRQPDQGLDWYRAHFPLALPGSTRRWLTGEATPYLLFDPPASARVAAALPAARFIALLRDPVDRAVSHWQMETRRGRESLPFAEALDAEPARLGGLERSAMGHRLHSYVARGEYVDQLERWIASVGRERLLIVQSERLFRHAALVVAEVIAWLGLPLPPAGRGSFTAHNAGDRSDVDPVVRERLAQHYAPFNERLFALLGTTYDWTVP